MKTLIVSLLLLTACGRQTPDIELPTGTSPGGATVSNVQQPTQDADQQTAENQDPGDDDAGIAQVQALSCVTVGLNIQCSGDYLTGTVTLDLDTMFGSHFRSYCGRNDTQGPGACVMTPQAILLTSPASLAGKWRVNVTFFRQGASFSGSDSIIGMPTQDGLVQ